MQLIYLPDELHEVICEDYIVDGEEYTSIYDKKAPWSKNYRFKRVGNEVHCHNLGSEFSVDIHHYFSNPQYSDQRQQCMVLVHDTIPLE